MKKLNLFILLVFVLSTQTLFAQNQDNNKKLQSLVSSNYYYVGWGYYTKTIDSLINEGADVNYIDSTGNAAIHKAVINVHLNTIELLKYYNADFSLKNKDDKTALQIAEEQNEKLKDWKKERNENIIKYLKEPFLTSRSCALLGTFDKLKKVMDENKKNNREEYANIILLYSVRTSIEAKKKVEYLFQNNIKIDEDYLNKVIIHSACKKENGAEILKILIDNGADVNTKGYNNKTAPIFIACRLNNIEIVKILIDNGADVNAVSGWFKDTPIFTACWNNNIEIVKLLIENGAEINAKDGIKQTPIHSACGNNDNIDIVKYLIDNDANVNVKDETEQTPLFYACKNNNGFEIVKYLIDNDANINVEDYAGRTPLHYACLNANGLETVKILIDNGADINARTNEQRTALTFAKQNKNGKEIVDFLLKNKAKPGTTTNRMLNAIKSENLESVKLIIENGYEINSLIEVDYDGCTAVEYATKLNYTEISKYLIDNGADLNRLYYYDKDLWHKGTILNIAVENNNIELVKHMLDNGVEIKLFNYSFNNPLHIAAKNNYTEILNLLNQKLDKDKKKNKKQKTTSNNSTLLQNELVIYQLIGIDTAYISKQYEERIGKQYFEVEYCNNIDFKTIICNKITSPDFKTYKAKPYMGAFWQAKEDQTLMSSNDVREKLGAQTEFVCIEGGDSIEIFEQYNKEELIAIAFYDVWDFDAQNFTMQKTVKAYLPDREYFRDYDVDQLDPIYSLITSLFFDNELSKKEQKKINSRMQLFMKVKYEFNINNTYEELPENYHYMYERENSSMWTSYAKEKFTFSILSEVLSGNRPAYDFNTNKQLTINEIRAELGEKREKVLIEINNGFDTLDIVESINFHEIKSFVFIEEWYIDSVSLQINKKVVGIAPVRHYYREDDIDRVDVLKKILFVVYFEGLKPE